MSDEATRESLRIWNGVAPGWEKLRDRVNEQDVPVTEALFAALGARDGDTILELTAGTGGAGLQLAERLPQANLIITDFAPNMVAAVDRAVAERGLKNVETRIVDAQSIGLPNSSVDGVLSRYGLMIVPDLRKAFAEIRRVLKPGRALAYAVWSPVAENPWMMLVGATLMQRGHFTPPPGGGFFPLTSEEENVAVAREAGFTSVTTEVMKTPMVYESFDAYWETTSALSGPMVEIIAGLPEEERRAVRDTIEEYAQPFRTGSGLELPASRILVRAS